jgi:hypothetical protein
LTTSPAAVWSVENANILPAPVQQPRPPLTPAGWGPKSLRASDNPFDSDEAFHDFVGKHRKIGIDEFIIYWWREDTVKYGYERSIVERCTDRGMLEHLATETIPKLQASPWLFTPPSARW